MFLANNNDAKAGGSQISKEKMSLEILYEKVTEGLLANVIQKIQAQSQTKSQVPG
jgi:hypothetical protein